MRGFRGILCVLLAAIGQTTAGPASKLITAAERGQWYDFWKIPAGKPGTLLLDKVAQHGYLRGAGAGNGGSGSARFPTIVDDPRATGINAYAAALAAAPETNHHTL